MSASPNGAGVAAAPPTSPPAQHPRRRWGIRVAESLNGWYMVAALVILSLYVWFNGRLLHHMIGKDTVVEVVRVVDGDTFLGRTVPGGIASRFRLRSIDAPEKDQPYGPEATAALQELLIAPNREVNVFLWEQDPWGRYVVDVATRDSIYTKMTFVQHELVKLGFAWVFLAGDSPLRKEADSAKSKKVGLWKDDHPLEPWKFRRIKSGKAPIVQQQDLPQRAQQQQRPTARPRDGRSRGGRPRG